MIFSEPKREFAVGRSVGEKEMGNVCVKASRSENSDEAEVGREEREREKGELEELETR